jgi:hypothetical protein
MRFAVPGFTVCLNTDASCLKERTDPLIAAIPMAIP